MTLWSLFACCTFAHTFAAPVGRRGRNLIFNGTDVAEERPWHVHTHGCGGTILSSNIVLTAAHCNRSFAVGEFVWAGALKHSNIRLAQQRVVVKHIFDPKQKLIFYDNPITGAPAYSAENDYMLVRIEPPWFFNEKVNKASLPTQNITGYSSSEFEMTGNGDHGKNSSEVDVLQSATVTYVPCTDNNKGQFCAGGKKGGWKDACVGDSGSPLVVKGTSIVVGIASWGADADIANWTCSFAATNGTKFTEVYQILDFINNVLAENVDAPSPTLSPPSANISECNTIHQPGVADRTCKFPFESYGTWHLGCTNLFEYEKVDNFWCATGSDTWAYCNMSSCPASQFFRQCLDVSDCEALDLGLTLPTCVSGFCHEGFQCGVGGKIAQQYVCDGIRDCEDNSDEVDCKEFRCDNGQNILQNHVCDGHLDCDDKSDEVGCPMLPESINKTDGSNKVGTSQTDCFELEPGWASCERQNADCKTEYYPVKKCVNKISEEFRCDNGKKISQNHVCDGNPDCDDRTDEVDCPMLAESSNKADGSSEVGTSQTDCFKLEAGWASCEKQNADCKTEYYPVKKCVNKISEEFRCDNGKKISQNHVCDGNPDCDDRTDEVDCPMLAESSNKADGSSEVGTSQTDCFKLEAGWASCEKQNADCKTEYYPVKKCVNKTSEKIKSRSAADKGHSITEVPVVIVCCVLAVAAIAGGCYAYGRRKKVHKPPQPAE